MSMNKWLMPLSVGLLSLFFSLGVISADSIYKINSGPCVKCHKRNGLMQGHHAQDARNMSCSSCHGEKGNHPRKPNDLMVFSSESEISLESKNAVCLKCHIPEKLAAKEWTHNVHAQKLSCPSCHTLHSVVDPIVGLSAKDHSHLCRDCHTALK